MAALVVTLVVGAISVGAAAGMQDGPASPDAQVAPGAGIVVPAQATGCNGYGGVVAADFAKDYPVPGVSVTLLDGGATVAQTTTAADGTFCIQTSGVGDELLVELRDQRSGMTLVAETAPPSKAVEWSSVPSTRTIELRAAVDPAEGVLGLPIEVIWAAAGNEAADRSVRSNLKEQFASQQAALAYTDARVYLDWAVDSAGFADDGDFAAAPVSVLFDNKRYVGEKKSPTFSFYDGGDKLVYLGHEAGSFTVWHELTHYITDLALINANADTTDPDFDNHAGVRNDSTADSIIEGSAMWAPAVFFTDAIADVDAVSWYRGFGPLESNKWQSWSASPDGKLQREDVAFAALLWDLMDGEADPNATDLLALCEPVTCDSHTMLALDDTDIVDITVTDRVWYNPDELLDLIAGLDLLDTDVASLREALFAYGGTPPEYIAPTVDLDGTGRYMVAPLDVPFLMHGFFPCPSGELCVYDMTQGVIGRTDRPYGGAVQERRIEPLPPGASIRLINDETLDKILTFSFLEEGVTRTAEYLLEAGETVTIPFQPPPYYDAPLDGAPLPDCTAVNDAAQVVMTITDADGGSVDFDACEMEHLITESDGQAAFSYLVGDASLRYRVEFVDASRAGEADVITLDQGLGFADLQTAVAGIDAGVSGTSLAIDGQLKLYVPALEALSPVRMTGAIIELSGATAAHGLDSFAARLRGQIMVGDEVLDLDVTADFANSGDNLLESFALALDLTGADGDSVIDSGDIVALLGELGAADPQAVADFTASLPPVSLDGLHADFAWTPTDLSVDIVADTTIGDLGLGLLLSFDDSDTTDPRFLIGARFDNAADPDADTIALSALLGVPSAQLAVDLDLPEFALASSFGGSGPVTGADLRTAQSDFFGPEGLPDDLDIGGKLSFAASIEMSVFDGTGLDRLLSYTATDTIDIAGTLGFDLQNLETGGFPITDVEISAELPTATGTEQTALPEWLTIDGSTITFRYADDTLGLFVGADATVAVDGQSLGITAEIGVETNGSTTTLSFSGGTTSAWDDPFGVEWLTIDSVELGLTVVIDDSGATFTGGLNATVTVGGKQFDLAIEGQLGGTSPEAKLTLEQVDPITVDELLGVVLPASFDANQIPLEIRSLTFSDTTIVVTANSTSIRFSATATFTVDINGHSVGATALVAFDTGGDFVFGIRPEGELAVQDVIDGVPSSLPRVPIVSDDASFGILINSGDVSQSAASMDAARRAFFAPLYGSAPDGDFTVTMASGVRVLGNFALPDDLGEVLNEALGIRPGVQLSGTLPLFGGTAVSFEMGLTADPARLPEFIKDAGLALVIKLDPIEGALGVGLQGNLTLRVRAGMDPAAAQTLRGLGVEVQEAVPVQPSDTCANGNTPEPVMEPEYETVASDGTTEYGPTVERHYCFDYLKFEAGAFLELSLPGRLGVELEGAVTAVDIDGNVSEWNPFGLDVIGINTLQLKLGLAVDLGPPVGVQVTLGFAGGGRLLDKDVFVAAQFGAKFLPNPPWVIPVFDGLRVSSANGIEIQDLVDVANTINEVGAQAAGRPAPQPIVLDGIPNIGLKNLDFSISPLGVSDLCIPAGLVVGTDLYLDPPAGLDLGVDDKCNAPPPPPCSQRQADGCFAGARLSVGLDGIFGNAFLGAFEIGPLKWDGAELDIAVSIPDTHFRLSGGASIEVPDGTVLAGGELAVEFRPLAFDFFGRVEIYGVSALVDGTANLEVWNGDPELSLHVVLAADGAEVGEPNFNTLISAVAAPPLEVIRTTVLLADGVLDDVETGDLAEVILNLPDRLEGANLLPAGCSTDPQCDFHWLFEIRDAIQPTLDALPTDLLPRLVEVVLNGAVIDIPGVEQGFSTVCFVKDAYPLPGFVYDGVCYNTVLGAYAGGLGEFRDVCVGELQDGKCWVLGLAPRHIELFTDPSLCDTLFPAAQYPGLRDTEGNCRFENIVDAILVPLLDDAIRIAFDDWPGINELRTALVEQLRDAETLFEFECVEFDLALTPEEQAISLGLAAIVYDADLAFEVGWDFTDPIEDNLLRLLNGIFGSFTGDPPDVCGGVNTTVFNPTGGGAFEPPVAPAQVGGTLPSSAREGTPVTFSGRFDKATTEARTITIDWGDGTTSTVETATGATDFSAAHTYADDDLPGGGSTATVRITDPSSPTTEITRTISVANVAPSVGAISFSDDSIDEGGTVTVSGTFTDPGTDTHTVEIVWRDGTSSTQAVPAGAREFSADHRYVDDDPTATPSDDVPILVRVRDDDRGVGTGSATLTVANVAPTGLELVRNADPITGDTTVFEGTPMLFTVNWSDVGTRDTHTVEIDWGDGTTTAVPTGTNIRTFGAAHTFADDDPSGTPQDTYTVTVTVTDDDTGSVSTGFPVTVVNVDPSPSVALNGTLDTLDDVINEDGTVDLVAGWIDPGVLDDHTVRIDWGDGDADELTPAAGVRQITASHRYLDDDPTATPADTYAITVTVTDDDTGEGVGTASLVVGDVAPAVETDTPTQAVQYSDPGETMTFTATDVERDTLTAEVWFDEGSVAYTSGLPSWLELSPDGDCTTDSTANRRTCTWTVTPVPDPTTGIYTDADPGTYTVRLRITDDDTLSTDLSATIVVLPEDARAVYVGPTYAATDDFRDDTTTVELRAVIQDITLATDDPAWDPYPGDVLKATTRFVDRERNDELLCEATLGYTFADEIGLATAVCDWEADIGRSDARSWVIGTIVGDPGYDPEAFVVGDPATHADPAFGRYIRNQTDDDTVVLVARPIDESINGGGYLVLSDSAGVYEGDVDTKANFGFNVKFNKRGTNLQGQVTLIVRADGHVYRIKTNSLTSLGVVEIDGDGNGVAQFEAKANIVDVTDENDPVSLGGNLTLQMRMTDLGEPGDADTIGFSLWGRDGELLFSSNWDEVQTVEQTLDGGNLTVHP